MSSNAMNDITLRFVLIQTAVLAVLLTGIPAHAKLSDVEMDVLQSIFSQSHNPKKKTCAYTQTAEKHENQFGEESNETTVARFDPILRPESPWKVLSVNDRDPTDHEIRNFRPEFENPVLTGTGKGRFDYPDIDDMKVVSKDDDIWIFEGPVSIPMPEPEDAPKPLRGFGKKFKFKMIFEVHEPTATLRAIRIALRKPVRFWLVVRISKVEFAMLFGEDPAVEGSVMKEMTMEMKAGALGRSMIMSHRTNFSDFECSENVLVSEAAVNKHIDDPLSGGTELEN